MFGRRTVLVICAAGAVAFGGGGAFAATQGGSHHSTKPTPAKRSPAANVHYPCRHHDTGSIAGLV